MTGAARAETPSARERETIISKERIEEIKKSVYGSNVVVVLWRKGMNV